MHPSAARLSLLGLPVEIPINITLHLNWRHQHSLLLTCRHLADVVKPQLWRKLRISDKACCKSLPQILQTSPTLAQTVVELELYTLFDELPDAADEREDESIYLDLALAASLPNLRHLDIMTTCLDYDPARSKEAAEGLAKLRFLESCSIARLAPEVADEFWFIEQCHFGFSLINHPAMRHVRLHRFESFDDVTPRPSLAGTILGQERATPLQKLTLNICDLHTRALAELMRVTQPRELELVFDRESGSFGFGTENSVRLDHTDLVETIWDSGHTTLERLTFFVDCPAADPHLPLYRFEHLKYLCTDLESLCGKISKVFDGKHLVCLESPKEMLLPPQLERIDLLYTFHEESWQEDLGITTLNFLEKHIVAHQRRNNWTLRELQFANFWTLDTMRAGRYETPVGRPRPQELQEWGTRCGLTASLRQLPEFGWKATRFDIEELMFT